MTDNPTRRKFLRSMSLAGAALVVGDATAGAVNGEVGREAPRGAKKVWAWVSENGCLEIENDQLEAELYAIYRVKNFICVTWDDPNSEGNKINSLCTC